ncbi:hypothetical protein [Sphingobacterium griseoflavum]|uniref:Uncharacterized protein n=1 Tax=Sphingobacterium griseoflavum TaxID=1474952 RepID=A0ABQ3HUU5_9SPHI|nr:hypothetical protein [Sphingobacterium griseoflavum]GHE30623.1 hypothetical protein GCM10017764_11940 [Sphingobacterium griseoflavum]
MIASTQHNLGKLEDLFSDLGYRVRYEKGSFRTGACVLQHTKVIMVNKFSNLEVRIQSLILLLREMEVDTDMLDDKKREFFRAVKKVEALL